MDSLFLKILNMSISASWLVLAVVALRLILKKAPKWVSVLLWGIVAVRLICPFSFESVLSLIPSAQTIPIGIEMEAAPAIDSGIPVINNAVNPIISQSFAPEPSASANPLQILIPVAAIVWLVGFSAMLIYTAVSYWLLRRKMRTAVLCKDNIFQSEHVASPFVLGIFKPRIYLPFQMNPQDLAHVVAHEQSHIRRKDHWWKPLGFLLLAIHWFNPLMWLAYILLCRDIELACDEKVIKELGSDQRADYSQALLSCSISRRSIAACPLAFGEVGVKERVKSVMKYKKPAFWIILAAVVICAIVAVCFLTDPAQSKVQNIYDQKGYTILEQEKVSLTLQIPTGSLNEFIYTPDGYQFQPGEVVVWQENGTSVYLSHAKLQNEEPYEYLYFVFGYDYSLANYSSILTHTHVNSDHSFSCDFYMPDNTMWDSSGQVFLDALNERGTNGHDSFELYVSKEACQSAKGTMLMEVELNRISYAKDGFEAEAATFFQNQANGQPITLPSEIPSPHPISELLQKKIRKAMYLPDSYPLTCVGEYSKGIYTLLWVCYEVDGMKHYEAVACEENFAGELKFKNICDVMTYTTDIIHTLWMGEDIYLINNPNCRSIICKDENGTIVQQIDIGENEYPYVYRFVPPANPCTMLFADANGNDLQFSQPDTPIVEFDFLAEVLEIHDGYYTVKPGDGWPDVNAGIVEVPMENIGASPEPQVGDTLIISCRWDTLWEALEGHPVRLAYVSRIRVVEIPEFGIPKMIRYNAVVYSDTGIKAKSQHNTEADILQVDSVVDADKIPRDNNQANFGTAQGIVFRPGSVEGTIEVEIDGTWWIFAWEGAWYDIVSSHKGT